VSGRIIVCIKMQRMKRIFFREGRKDASEDEEKMHLRMTRRYIRG
jgi:hypothetical protein